MLYFKSRLRRWAESRSKEQTESTAFAVGFSDRIFQWIDCLQKYNNYIQLKNVINVYFAFTFS